MRAMANRTDLMRAILFGAPPVTLAIFKLANCCFCCSRAALSSVRDCDRRSDVFTWDPGNGRQTRKMRVKGHFETEMLLLRAQSQRFECARAVIAVKCMQTMHLFARYRPRTFASLSILGHFFRFFSPAERRLTPKTERTFIRARAQKSVARERVTVSFEQKSVDVRFVSLARTRKTRRI